jgi:hypothetical protein
LRVLDGDYGTYPVRQSRSIVSAARALVPPWARPTHKTLALRIALLGLVALSAGLLVYATTPLGAGVDTDSVNYLSAATSLSRAAGYFGWDGHLETYFPPGYSLVLALGRILSGVGVAQVAQAVDVVLLAALVLATYYLTGRVIASRALRLLVTALVALSPIVLEVYARVSSETFFNFLCVVALIMVYQLRRQNPLSPTRYWVALGLLAAIAAMAALTRLAGVALVLSLAITLVVVASPSRRLVVRAVESLGFCLVALAPITAWGFVVHSQTGSWTFGDRSPSPTGFGTNLLTAAHTLSGWPSPPSLLLPAATWLDMVVPAALVVVLAIGLSQLVRTRWSRLGTAAPVLIFCVVYPTFLIAVSSSVGLAGALDSRYFSPMLAPLVVLVGFLVDLTWMRARRPGWAGRGMAAAVTGAMALSLVSSLVASGRDSQQRHVDGNPGATATAWNNSSVLRSARSLPRRDEELLLSDMPEMMSYSTGRLYLYPPFRAGGIPVDLQQQVDTNGSAYLVLVISEVTPDIYTPDELAQWFTVTLLDSSPDEQLFELSPLK